MAFRANGDRQSTEHRAQKESSTERAAPLKIKTEQMKKTGVKVEFGEGRTVFAFDIILPSHQLKENIFRDKIPSSLNLQT